MLTSTERQNLDELIKAYIADWSSIIEELPNNISSNNYYKYENHIFIRVKCLVLLGDEIGFQGLYVIDPSVSLKVVRNSYMYKMHSITAVWHRYSKLGGKRLWWELLSKEIPVMQKELAVITLELDIQKEAKKRLRIEIQQKEEEDFNQSLDKAEEVVKTILKKG